MQKMYALAMVSPFVSRQRMPPTMPSPFLPLTMPSPFLSYRSRNGHLICSVYTQVQQAITQCAVDFGFNPAWFKPHCIRMAAPTALRAAGGSDGQVLTLGRWKSVPTSLVYQGPSSKNNNRIADPTLITSFDILLSRILPSANRTNQRQVVRRFKYSRS